MSVKHKYNGWIILKTDTGYVAERQSDFHVAPMYYPRLRMAKQSIDCGEASLTSTQFRAIEYKQNLLMGYVTREHLEERVWKLGDKAAELALKECGY